MVRSHLPEDPCLFPSNRILEIAPGHGRWTSFLLDHCDDLLGVDLSESCIDMCREPFANLPKARFFVNDGTSLPMVHDNSVDFVFSFYFLGSCRNRRSPELHG